MDRSSLESEREKERDRERESVCVCERERESEREFEPRYDGQVVLPFLGYFHAWTFVIQKSMNLETSPPRYIGSFGKTFRGALRRPGSAKHYTQHPET